MFALDAVAELHVVCRLDRGTVPVAHDVHGDEGGGDGEQDPATVASAL